MMNTFYTFIFLQSDIPVYPFRFDTDRSGTIDARELNTAFSTFGYRL